MQRVVAIGYTFYTSICIYKITSISVAIPMSAHNTMSRKSSQTLLLLAAGVIALLFLKLMFDMSRSMSEMTEYVGAISRDVSEMQGNFHTMNESMQRMGKSIHDLGQAFSQGSQQFQQLNPAGMMQQMMPDGGQPAH